MHRYQIISIISNDQIQKVAVKPQKCICASLTGGPGLRMNLLVTPQLQTVSSRIAVSINLSIDHCTFWHVFFAVRIVSFYELSGL